MSGSRGGFSVTISAEDRASKVINDVSRRIAEIRAPADRVTRSLSKLGDTSGITALDRGMRDVARHSLEAFANVTRLSPALAGVTGAASIAGITALAAEFSRFGSQLGFSAQRAGLTATRLHELQGVARLAGSSAEALTSGLTALNDNLTNAAAGRAPEAVQAFNYLGIALRGADGHLRTVTEVLPELREKLGGIRNPALQTRLAMTLLGGAGEALLPVIRMTAAEFAEYTEKMRRFGVLNQQGVEAANRLRVAQTELSLAAEGLGYSIAQALEPALTPMLHDLAEWMATISQGDINKFAGEVRGLADDVIWLARGINTVVEANGGWKRAGEVVLAWYVGTFAVRMVAKIVGIGAAVVAVTRKVLALQSAVEAAGTGAGVARAGAGGISAGASAGIIGAGLAVIAETYLTNRAANEQMYAKAAGLGYEKRGGDSFFNPIPTFYNPKTGETLTYEQMQQRLRGDAVTPARRGSQTAPASGPNVGPTAPVGIPAPNPNHWGAPPPGTAAPAGTPPPAGAIPPSAAAGDAARQATVRDMLAQDLGITPAAASGIVSNLQAESGLQGINERNPVVPGSRGGFGWAQWTGSEPGGRRYNFEAYAAAHHLDPRSDEANYGFLVHELRTTFPQVLAQLRAGQITPQQAANIVFTGYESGGDPRLEPARARHVAAAERIASLPPAGTPSVPQTQLAANTPPWWERSQFVPSAAAAERAVNTDERPIAGLDPTAPRIQIEGEQLTAERAGQAALALKGLTQRLQTSGAQAGIKSLEEEREARRRSFFEEMHRWHYPGPETPAIAGSAPATAPVAGLVPPVGTAPPVQSAAPALAADRGDSELFHAPTILPAPAVPPVVAPAPVAPGIGEGTGASPFQAEAKITGGADLNINLTGFPQGTKTSAKTTGNAFLGAPRIDTALPMGMA